MPSPQTVSASNSSNQAALDRCGSRPRVSTARVVILGALATCALIAIVSQPSDASIGYFEHYGWPTYGVVKPFWMTPFSAFPKRSISGYSRKHPIYNSRGLLRYRDF